MSTGCSCNPESGLTRLTVAGAEVGLQRLADLFASWLAAGRQATELADAEILAGLRKHNYVSKSMEAEYAKAVRSRYSRYSLA